MPRSQRPRRTPAARPHARRRRARPTRSRRWPLLVLGLALAVVALYALVTLRPPPSGERIDEQSRAELESVLREAED